MAMMTSVGAAVKTLMIALLCTMVALFVYLFVFGDYITCFDLHARWGIQLLVDFSMFVIALGAWYTYKESSWIIAVMLIVPTYLLGSIISLGYILTQFYKLTPEESSKDPLYYVLARRQKRDVVEHSKQSFLVTARIIVFTLGCLALGTMIFMIIVDLSPSYIKYFTSCLLTNGGDVYIHVVIFSVWVAYKELSWKSALCWILLLLCFRGVIVCVYIARELFYLSPHQHVSLIIFNDKNKCLRTDLIFTLFCIAALHLSDPTLKAHRNE